MIAFLKSAAAKRVRTNNHVKRANRKLRYYEKVRYKWRRRRTIVRFLILALDRWWPEHPKYAATTAPASKRRCSKLSQESKTRNPRTHTSYNCRDEREVSKTAGFSPFNS